MKARSLFLATLLSAWSTSTLTATIFKDPFEIHQPVTMRVEITPGAKLLTQSGESSMLKAQVFDQSGKPIALPVSWRSSNDELVSVDSGGLITALSSLGTAQIIAEAPGALADIVLVTIADPVDGAQLVDDHQVVGFPTPVDSEAEYGLGYEYTVVLEAPFAAQVDDLLIGSGEIPIGGRVLAVSQGNDEVTVTLETVPLEALFDQLVIDEKMRLSDLPIEIQPDLADAFTATRLSDGSLVLSPKDLLGKGPQGTSISQFLECETSLPNWQNILTVNSGADIIIDPTINFDIVYNSSAGGLQRFVASGGLNAVLELRPRLIAAFEGKITCKFQVGRVPIPVGGPLSWFFSGQVPLGVGVEVSGKISAPPSIQPGYDLTVLGNANFSVGIVCEPNCDLSTNLDIGVDGTARLVIPTLDAFVNGLQLDLGGFLFAYADLEFGNPFLAALRFTALGIKAGLKQSGSFRSVEAQVSDPAYASDFKLELTGSAGAGNGIQKFLQLFLISTPPLELFNISSLISQSPKGTLSISPDQVDPGNDNQLGEQATFTVNLNPTTYLGAYNVEEVTVYWLKPDGQGGTTLEMNRPGCNTLTASNGQTQFECSTDFLEEHVGQHNFYAFVTANLLGVPVPIPLEIAKDSGASLTVGVEPTPTVAHYSGEASVNRSFEGTDLDSYDGPQPDSATAQTGPNMSTSTTTTSTIESLLVTQPADISYLGSTARTTTEMVLDPVNNVDNLTVNLMWNQSVAVPGDSGIPGRDILATARVYILFEVNITHSSSGYVDRIFLPGESEKCALNPSSPPNPHCEGESGTIHHHSSGLLAGFTGGSIDIVLPLEEPLAKAPAGSSVRISFKLSHLATINSAGEALLTIPTSEITF